MKVIMLSGGSGQRLWPLSNSVRSKQFLKLLRDKDGNEQSMIQRVYQQLKESGIDSDIVVATSKSQESAVINQLGDGVDIVDEPERRDTFPAIALSVAHLFFNKHVRPDALVAVIPVDPFTSIDFFKKINELALKMSEGDYHLGLLGIKPTYPSSKYGYIEIADGDVVGFVEKPSEEKAAVLIEEGALWNGGVFLFTIQYMLDIIRHYISFDSFEDVRNQYHLLPQRSFDYEVSEKETKITMEMFDGFWKDLGTWNTLTEEIDNQTTGEVVMAPTSINTHVINELDIPVVAIGAKDLIVAASPDGILISDKVESAQLKDYLQEIHPTTMYQEAHWGDRKVIDVTEGADGMMVTTSVLNIFDHTQLEIKVTPSMRASMYIVLSGGGTLVEANNKHQFSSKDTVDISHYDSFVLETENGFKVIEITYQKQEEA